MNNITWKIVMFCLVISVLGLTISYISQKREINELQTTVTRQANAIQQLEKEKNNTEVTIPQYLDSLPGGD
jgi:cell division protein FtsL